MAYLRPRREDEQQAAGLQGGAPAGLGAPVAGVTGAAPQAGSGFDDISAWLRANEAGGEQMAGALAGKLEGEASAAAAPASRPGFTAETAPAGDGILTDFGSAPLGGYAVLSGRAAEVGEDERARAGGALSNLRAAQTSTGRQALAGGEALDAALIGRAGAGRFGDLAGRYGGILGRVQGYQGPESGYWNRAEVPGMPIEGPDRPAEGIFGGMKHNPIDPSRRPGAAGHDAGADQIARSPAPQMPGGGYDAGTGRDPDPPGAEERRRRNPWGEI